MPHDLGCSVTSQHHLVNSYCKLLQWLMEICASTSEIYICMLYAVCTVCAVLPVYYSLLCCAVVVLQTQIVCKFAFIELCSISITEMQTTNGINSQLSITHSDRQDSGVYKCVAENPFGKSEHVIYVAVQGMYCILCVSLSSHSTLSPSLPSPPPQIISLLLTNLCDTLTVHITHTILLFSAILLHPSLPHSISGCVVFKLC